VNSFPRAQLKLTMHETRECYLNYIAKNNSGAADLVCAADIEDTRSISCSSQDEYEDLCVQTLKAKQDSCNILLGRESLYREDNNKISLIKIALRQAANSVIELSMDEYNCKAYVSIKNVID